MRYVKCPHCGTRLVVHDNDYLPGCREMEDAYCPICKHVADRLFTSGIPTAYVDERKNN